MCYFFLLLNRVTLTVWPRLKIQLQQTNSKVLRKATKTWSFQDVNRQGYQLPRTAKFDKVGLTKKKEKAPVRDNRWPEGGYQLSLLNQTFFFRFSACSHKSGCLTCYPTLLLHKMNWWHSAYFSQKVVMMESNKEDKKMTVKSAGTGRKLCNRFILINAAELLLSNRQLHIKAVKL